MNLRITCFLGFDNYSFSRRIKKSHLFNNGLWGSSRAFCHPVIRGGKVSRLGRFSRYGSDSSHVFKSNWSVYWDYDPINIFTDKPT